MKQTTVLLLFGGESSEHDVSLSSARNVYDALNKQKYQVILCYIDRDGSWHLVSEINDTKSGEILHAQLGTGSFITSSGREITPEVILPILHGKNGEDGSVQGLAQLMHLPIVGCDMTASVLAMDKTASKAVFIEAGLMALPYMVHRAYEPMPEYELVRETLGDIVFVKPSRAGSSVGVSRVTSSAEFTEAIRLATQHDPLVLIEQAASSPREIEVAVLGNASDSVASVPGEIQPDREFYSYEAKYEDSSQSALIIPANLDSKMTEYVKQQAVIAYDSLHCEGMARVDFLLDGDDNLYINEINTIPGFTNISMYPKLWQESGISYSELIDRLIELAILKI